MLLGSLMLRLQATQGSDAPTQRLVQGELVLRSYLTLAAVDARGRRPFRPDAVLARYQRWRLPEGK